MEMHSEHEALENNENDKNVWRRFEPKWTLIIFIIITTLFVIVAFAVLNPFHSRIQKNEAATIGNLRTINGAQIAYNSITTVYAGSFKDLLPYFQKSTSTFAKPFKNIEADGSVITSGYRITVAASDNGHFYVVYAIPIERGYTGNREFMTDTSGLIGYRDDPTEEWSQPPFIDCG